MQRRVVYREGWYIENDGIYREGWYKEGWYIEKGGIIEQNYFHNRMKMRRMVVYE